MKDTGTHFDKKIKMSNVQLYQSRIFTGLMHMIFCFQYYYALYFDWYFLEIPKNSKIPKIMEGFGGKIS